MIQSKSKALILLVVIFLLGIVAGMSINWMVFKRPPVRQGGDFRSPRKERIIEHLKGRLKLTPDQVNQLRTVLDDTDRQIAELYKPLRSQHETIFNSMRERVMAFLTNEQKQEYEKMNREMEQRRGEHGRPGPGSPEQDDHGKQSPGPGEKRH